MNWTTLARLLATHWKTSAIVALILTLGGGCAALWIQRDHALVDRGKALERARVADSTLTANAAQLHRIDTQLVHDTVTVRRTIARVDTLRDSLMVHLHDTAYVLRYANATDSARQACSDLTNDCAEFRRVALQRFSAYETKIAGMVPKTDPPRRCGLSLTMGVGVVRDGGSTHAGPGVAAGVGCRW